MNITPNEKTYESAVLPDSGEGPLSN